MDSNSPSTKGPAWIEPEGKPLTDLKVYNTISKTKVPFIAKNGRHVTWYICGPTVYDASHMGHARNYIASDIIRRIVTDYFGYDVTMVMNITDIDDKIILRSRDEGVSFTEWSRKWEKDFLEDMRALQVHPPDVLTRVSEYIPSIIDFVQGIIRNGFGYESNGSVYFDTVAFSATHHYAKLQPNSVGDAKLQAEGEGALSGGGSEKKSINDFALWKKSKEGEPWWDSPWGKGRPGWHIECSAMAGDVIGDNLDIHSGGEDLKFPHHDNELAQCEAYFGSQQWVNYFLHIGHLHINGCKMSKSLKNFITIKQCLQTYNPRQIRMLFLLHKYDGIMDYSIDSMGHAVDLDKTFSEFFHSIKSILRNMNVNDNQRWEDKEKELNAFYVQTRNEVHNALADNFNTPAAVHLLAELVRKTNIYISQSQPPKAYLLQAIADYITSIFKVFGLIDSKATVGYTSGETTNTENVLGPVLDVFTQFRSKVREATKNKDISQLLELSDLVRDESLPLVGVRLDDLQDGSTRWKLDDKEVLEKEVALKRQAKAKKEADKQARLKKEQERLEAGKIPPEQLFRQQTDKYSQFDEKGIPTHDAKGEPLAKSAVKKVAKEYQAQAKLHEAFLKATSSAVDKDNNNN